MSRIFIALVFLIWQNKIMAQLHIHAGENKAFLTSQNYPICPLVVRGDTLGGAPTVLQGTPPYTYTWELVDSTKYKSLPTRYASYYLSDTTISNPILLKKDILQDSLNLILTVKDSNNLSAKDTITLFKVQFKYVEHNIFKNQLDTVTSCGPSFGIITIPIKYEWRPNYKISDTTSNCPKFWSSTSLMYYFQVTDNFGCKSEFTPIELSIQTSNNKINTINFNIDDLFETYQNPIHSSTVYKISKDITVDKIEIYNTIGEKIHTQKSCDFIQIGKISNTQGIYYMLVYAKEKIYSISIIKE